MTSHEFRPGSRLSRLDMFVLVLGMAGTIALGATIWQVGLVIGVVVLHFFLFCNVLRLSRPLELGWAGVFLALAAATIVWDAPGWAATVAVSLGLTALVAALEMRRPSYHGVGWRSINPRLHEWWQAQVAESEDAGTVDPAGQ